MKRVMLAGGLLPAFAMPAFLTPAFLKAASPRHWKMPDRHQQSGGGRRQHLVQGWPYKSRDDAKLARSTIDTCPKVDPGKEEGDEK